MSERQSFYIGIKGLIKDQDGRVLILKDSSTGKGNDAFVCTNCSADVQPLTSGSYRNHCPECLYSRHVDIVPGGRRSVCGGLMQPIGVDHMAKKGWMIVHLCMQCGHTGRNKAALDDAQPDNYELVCNLSTEQISYYQETQFNSDNYGS